MINFAIVPVNFYDARVNQTWDPKAWPAIRRELNPYDDPFIDRINLLIYNLKRQIKLRSQLICDLWLHRIGELDELVIQAEHDHYVAELARLENIYRAYIFDHYFEREADSWDPAKMHFQAQDPPVPPATYESPSILIDLITNSKDPYEIEPVATRALARGELPKNESDRYKVPNQVTRRHIEKQAKASWESSGPQSWAIATSFNHLLWEFSRLKEQDALHGIAGKARMFLLNEAIPLPNRHTWLAWYSLVGIGWQRIPGAMLEPIRRMTGKVDSVLQFTLPNLPATTEHVSGIPNPSDDSGSGHSLSSKSAAHERNVYGKILHGRWEAYTICTDIEGDGDSLAAENLIIDDIVFGTTTGRSLSESGLAMWGLPKSIPLFYEHATGIVSDPYFRFMYRQPLHYQHIERHAFDTGMRSLSQFHNVHLRFSGNEFGALCAKEWRDAFVAEAIRFIRMTDADRLANEFEAALLRQQVNAIQAPKVRGRKQKHDFGVDEIFGSDS